MKFRKYNNLVLFLLLWGGYLSVASIPVQAEQKNLSGSLSIRNSSSFLNELSKYKIQLDSVIKFENVPYDSIPGANPEQLKFDLYVNQSNLNFSSNDSSMVKSPLLFFIHGGSWREGDKGYDLERVKMMLNKGYIFVSTNYRLSPNPPDTGNPSRIKFPDHLNDVTKAFAKVFGLLPQLNGDTSRIAVLGHSAGGNLALSLASMEGYLDKYGISLSSIKAAINFDGGGIDIDSIMKSINGSYRKDFINAFGNSSEDWRKASPALNFKKDSSLANFLLICQDQPSRSKYSFEFSNLLNKSGIKSAVYLATGYDHNETIMKFCECNDESSKLYTENIFKFLEEAFNK